MRRQYYPSIFGDLENLACCATDYCEQDSQPTFSEGISISEDKEHFFVDAHLPGIDPKEIDVSIDPKQRCLSIRGHNKHERKDVNYITKSRAHYSYDIPLSSEVDIGVGVEASSHQGMLTVTLAKSKHHQPLKIDIKVE